MLPPSPPAPLALRVLGAAVDWTVVAMGAAIIVIVFSNVILHQFDYDIAWTTEFGEFVMVWVTFLGGAAAARRGAHMAVTELLDQVGGLPRRLLDVSIQLVVAGVLLLLIWHGWRAANASWGNILTVLGWPAAVQYLALPVGSVITLIFVVYDLKLISEGRTRAERYGD